MPWRFATELKPSTDDSNRWSGQRGPPSPLDRRPRTTAFCTHQRQNTHDQGHSNGHSSAELPGSLSAQNARVNQRFLPCGSSFSACRRRAVGNTTNDTGRIRLPRSLAGDPGPGVGAIDVGAAGGGPGSLGYCQSANQCVVVYTRCGGCDYGVAINESHRAAHNDNLNALCAAYNGAQGEITYPSAKPMWPSAHPYCRLMSWFISRRMAGCGKATYASVEPWRWRMMRGLARNRTSHAD
jgi:hypothetical protein